MELNTPDSLEGIAQEPLLFNEHFLGILSTPLEGRKGFWHKGGGAYRNTQAFASLRFWDAIVYFRHLFG